MAFIRATLVDLIARNLGHPKGVTGQLVMSRLAKWNLPVESLAVKYLEVQPDHKVLEVGFGPGVGLDAALKKVEHGSGTIYGLEISEQMVNSAKKRLQSATERNKLDVRLGSVMELPYPDDYFDRVFHTNCYYFWPSLEQGVSELKRVMKPGGLMVTALVLERVKEFHSKGFMKYGQNWAPEKYMETLTQGGFTDVAMEMIRNDPSKQGCQIIFASKPLQK